MPIVLYYLVHFNAIDMLYVKLKHDGVVIHLNIAGLVLEAEKFVFPYHFPSELNSQYFIDGPMTLYQLSNFIRKYDNVFTEDSLDFYYLSTAYQISNEHNKIHGIARYKVDVYEFRKHRIHYPYGALVSFRRNHGDYVISAHELAHLFDVDHDSLTDGCYRKYFQCFGILQEVVSYCINCLKWSVRSRVKFQTYVSTNLNRCYLLNTPRSLQHYGDAAVTLGPAKQCDCYGFHSHAGPYEYLDSVGSNECQTDLACVNSHQPSNRLIPRLIDGTPCELNKVCWQNECRQWSTWRYEKNNKASSHVRKCIKN